MPIKELNSYSVQSESDKRRWFTVILRKWGKGFRYSCTCPEHIFGVEKRCKHVRRAITCFRYGF